MNHLTPESEQKEYIERARAWHLELLKAKEQDAAKIPEYERGA